MPSMMSSMLKSMLITRAEVGRRQGELLSALEARCRATEELQTQEVLIEWFQTGITLQIPGLVLKLQDAIAARNEAVEEIQRQDALIERVQRKVTVDRTGLENQIQTALRMFVWEGELLHGRALRQYIELYWDREED